MSEDFSIVAKKGVNAALTDSQFEKLKVIREENPDLSSFASVIKWLIDEHKSKPKEETLDIDRTNIDTWLKDLNKA
jgi:hypothetical protein